MARSHELLRPRPLVQRWRQPLRLSAPSAILCAAVFVGSASTVVRAAGVVGTGTTASCTDGTFNAALAGGGLVTFNCGGPATIDVSTGTGTKTIATDTTIDGGSLITISGGNSVAVFSVNAGVTFTVQNLTIANGNSASYPGGGGISNGGTLTVTNSTFSDNGAAYGGGIYNAGTVIVTNSTFSENSASYYGGGGAISNSGMLTVSDSAFSGNGAADGGGIDNEGDVTITNSSFSGNGASYGGAIMNFIGTLTVTTSTFSGNNALYGGGISNGGTLTVTNNTFSGNSAHVGSCAGIPCGGTGGGIDNEGHATVTNSTFSGNSGGGIANGGTLTVANSIVANSTLGGNCSGTITDGGHNIDDGVTCGFMGTGCTPTSGSSFCRTNPQLDPAGLANNGGHTQTIALPAGSPAINAGDPQVCANPPVNGVDQRGYVRPGVGSTNCSIGAYEFDSPGPAPCVGDCKDDDQVSVNEILTVMNIALGNAEMSECESGDANKDGQVTVDEILMAVNNALNGCPRTPEQG